MTSLLQRFSFAILLSGALCPLAASNQWYVSPSSTGGDGTFGNPWTLQTALNQPSAVVPGDTIWLRGGTYVGTFVSTLNGALDQPITVRSYPTEWAVIDRAATGLFPATLDIRGSWTWFWGFEVTNSDTIRSIPTTGSNPDDGRAEGIIVYGGRNIKLINLIVHDSGNGINDNSGGVETEIYGSIVYHNGWDAPDRGHGHGIYSQNQTGTKRILDNILFSGFSHGIHIYGSDTAYLNNFDIEGNIGFNSGMLQTYFEQNFLVGGSGQCLNPYIANNYSYFSNMPALGPGSFDLGYSAGCTNAVLLNNYLESTSLFVANQHLSMTGNTFAGLVEFVGGNTPSENLSDYPGNTQIPNGVRPTGVQTFIRPNQYEPGRGHVAIFNWSGLSAVNVDLSTILTVGSPYEVRDAQNPFGPPVANGTYSGGTIAIPMTETTIVAPIGTTPAYFHTNSDFGAFIVIPPGTLPGSLPTSTVAMPVISPIGSNWTVPVTVTLISPTPGASIYFTIDGSAPTLSSPLYTAPFTLNASALVKAKAVKSGMADSPIASASYTITLPGVDTTPPVRSNGAPSGTLAAGTTTATLSLSTDEPATCAYATADVAYSNMTVFSATNALAHSSSVTGLSDGTSYTYYVRCRDTVGNSNPDSLVISFSVASPGQDPGLPSSGLKLWLRADAGAVLNGGNVSSWMDQSSSGADATQASPSSQPAWVPGAVNGQPVLRFNGTSQYMNFTLPVNGLTGATLILVTANSPDLDGSSIGARNAPLSWGETGSWGTMHLSPFQRYVKYRFGTGQAGNLPAYTRPVSIGSAASVTTAIKDGTTEFLYVDGALAMSQSGKLSTIANITDAGQLGTGYGTYYQGDIAEVLVYNRALSDTERQQVEQYLLTKYVNQPEVTAAIPVIAPNGGSSNAPVNVTLTSATAGASIYYTTDGNPPTIASTLYTAQFTLNASATVKALAVKSGLTDSAVASANFVIDTTPPVRSNGAPSGTLAAGTTAATLSLSTDENATCAYSTSDVAYASMTAFTATNALVHSNSITGLANGSSYTYYVRCRDTLGNTNPSSFLITFSVATTSVVATPAITPNGGSSNTPANVTLTSATSGASIYYTTNGNPPTTASTLYTAQFTLNASATVKALAVKSGLTNSAVASANFVIDTTPPVRSNGAPSGTLAAGTTAATLSLSTDENAACSYSTSDVAYASMTAFTATNALVHSTNITGLANGSSYTYYVRCRDTLGNANPNSLVISFSVASLPSGTAGWYQSGWHNRKAISVDHTRVADTLTNFPVLISLVDADLKTQALTSGNDIVFTSADGSTKLNHEIESYDSSTGTLVAWVSVPSLSSVADTHLYLYFGNPAAANQANPAAVWDSDFKAVWHMKENPAGTAPQVRDSTINANHGTADSMTASDQSTGIIGGSLSFDGVWKSVSVPDSASLDTAPAITLSTWIQTTAKGGNLNVINKTNGCLNTDGFMIWLNENTKGTAMPSFWVGGWTDATKVNLANGSWHQITTSNDGITTKIYVDGVLKAAAPRNGDLNTSDPLVMAAGECGNALKGRLDEVRLSRSARSAAWIATEYANGSAPHSFAILGAIEIN